MDSALHEVVARSARIRLKRERQVTKALSGAVLTCMFLLSVSFAALVSGTSASIYPEAYGAFLLPGEAGGYVLAGVIAFVLGAVLTLLFMTRKHGSPFDGLDASDSDPEDGDEKDGSHV